LPSCGCIYDLLRFKKINDDRVNVVMVYLHRKKA
jgi:hypothetical protein